MKKLLIFSISLLLGGLVMAQNSDEEFIERDFQLSFVTPLGTNGMESDRCINKVSINLFAGYAAGVKGAEFGGFANIITHDVTGVQFGGFLNVVGGNTSGFQASGFLNVNGGAVNATQFAGFTNINGGKISGAQFAGFTNISGGRLTGTQFAGFLNIAPEVNGAQVSGFMNITDRLNGLQLGVVNIVDSVESGVPISVFTIVKNGYNHWEVFISETMQANVAFKFGTSKFYNIVAAGAGFGAFGQTGVFGLGYGAGHAFSLPKGQISLDAVAYQLKDMQEPFDIEYGEYNQLAQLKLTYDYPTKHLGYFAGPAFNVLIQKTASNSEADSWKNYAPYSFYSTSNGDRRILMWAGLQAGIRF